MVDIAARPAEIGLHVDDDQRRVVGPQIAVVGPGIGVGVDVALGDFGSGVHGKTPVYLVIDSSPGAPASERVGEEVAIMMTRVRM